MGNRRIDETDEEFVGISDAIKYIKKPGPEPWFFACIIPIGLLKGEQ